MRNPVSISTVSVLSAACLLPGCATPRGGSVSEKQAFVREMQQRTLDELERTRPDIRQKIEKAPGYAVFSNANIHVLLLTTEHGYGVVVDNRTGTETYMRMAGLGAGLGAGLKDFRAVFIFHSDEALDRFVDQGWEFGAEAEAAAAAGQIGGAVGSQAAAGTSGAASGMAAKGGRHATTATMYRDLEIYQFTEAGLALQATLAGTKYWPDRALNP